MTIQEIKKYLKKHNLLTFEYGSEFYSIERSHSLFCTQYSLLDTDALPQRRDSLEKLCEQVYIGNGVLLSEAIHSIGIPEPDDSSWKTYKAVLHSAIVCGNEIHFFFRGKGYWIAYADDGKPMIVSTGMNDIKSVAKAVNIMEKYGVPYALMHTTNLYPTKPEWVRLGAMQEMMREFPNVPIGLSDHTLNNNACIAALALGADLVERHFTDEMARSGPDIICSMDEAACEELIQAAIEVPMMRGGTKGALPEEQVTIDFAFATVVTIAPVKKGEVFTKENIWVKRPGTGEILAKDFTKILGKKAVENIAADTQLKNDMVE